MLVQTEKTPNPNTLKFLPGKKVSEVGPVEFYKTDSDINISLAKEILSVKGISMVFFGEDFITVKKESDLNWDEVKPSIISQINDYYLKGNTVVVEKDSKSIKSEKSDQDSNDVVNKIKDVLDNKIRPAVARDGGDIKFKSFNDGIVKVELRGSCSGCPSSLVTLKQGVQNLLRHYVPEVKEVEAN